MQIPCYYCFTVDIASDIALDLDIDRVEFTLQHLDAGSPTRPTLRTFVWAWFEYQEPVSQRTASTSTPYLRRNPIVLALEWRQRLESGEAASRAELARQMGVTRAHVTQVLSLLQLAPEAKKMILALGDPITKRKLGIRTLRSL